MRAEDCDFACVCVTVSLCASSQCHGLSVCLCVHRGFEGCSHLRLGVGLCQYMCVLELRVCHQEVAMGVADSVPLGPYVTFSICMDVCKHFGEAHGRVTVSLCGYLHLCV